MTPRTGRPTDDPKRKEIKLRVSDATVDKLEYCHEKTGLPKAEIVRQGIDLVYDRLKASEQKEEG